MYKHIYKCIHTCLSTHTPIHLNGYILMYIYIYMLQLHCSQACKKWGVCGVKEVRSSPPTGYLNNVVAYQFKNFQLSI